MASIYFIPAACYPDKYQLNSKLLWSFKTLVSVEGVSSSISASFDHAINCLYCIKTASIFLHSITTVAKSCWIEVIGFVVEEHPESLLLMYPPPPRKNSYTAKSSDLGGHSNQVISSHGNPQMRRTLFGGCLFKYSSVKYQNFHQVSGKASQQTYSHQKTTWKAFEILHKTSTNLSDRAYFRQLSDW